ncbi:MAG TPA: ABC-F family ATP-binding cassette domain-containing protein [Acidimicrobiales bacterium]|nr:ABC-F family ATP-binding cassette domain-containing protein [Acidimicrobiales bacterium]
MPATLVARNLTVSFGERVVLDRVGVTVGPGDRVGVVAPNGTGKTTLLRALAGLQPLDRGSVTLAPPAATVGYLPQEPERGAGETVQGFLARRTGVGAASAALDAATAAVAGGTPGADVRYTDALERWMALGGADLDSRVGSLWADLGLPLSLLEQDMATLSGGQAARASMAGVLLSQFDVFLLDEPTNDLDFDGLDRLERFLDGLAAGVVVVSHDRAFLERTITSVVEIDDHDHTARWFDGGWAAYLAERATARRHAEEAFEGYRARRRELEDRARTQRQWAVQGVRTAKKRPRDHDKAQKGFFANRTEKQAAKVRITEKALARLEDVEKPWEGWDLRFSVAAAARSGDVVARLEGAVVERGSFRLGPLDLEIAWGDRLAILGPNGSGKSTLLAALLGRLPLAEGERWLGPSVVVGEIDQSRSRLSGDGTLLDAFTAESGMGSQAGARSLLAKFGLGAGHVLRPAASLTPGERTRATLAVLMARGVNCLVLDEPTNHLDLPAIEQLESALESYDGTLVLVTHDRRLLEAVHVDRTLTLG